MLRRRAGEIFREAKLAANRANPIGAGGNGVVFASDVEGNVMKQLYSPDQGRFGLMDDSPQVLAEADFQDVAAQMGYAPRVAGVETFRGGVGNRIEMEDIRPNFEMLSDIQKRGGPEAELARRRAMVGTHQQTGALALKGMDLMDRENPKNVAINKMTGRPMQLDFGIVEDIRDDKVAQLRAIQDATEQGFIAAGLKEEAGIFGEIVDEFMIDGRIDDAMDIAKQGFSRLQKIKPQYIV